MRILIVEDDISLLRAITMVLEDESYEIDQVTKGDEGLLMAQASVYDLLILDIMLPHLDGLSIIRQLRAQAISTPTLFLTAKDSVEARVKGLDAGADDYLVKPFAIEELLARVRSLLRRAGKIGSEGQIIYGPILISTHEHDAIIAGNSLKLTTKEYELLSYLVQNREQILTRDQIFDRIWGIESDTSDAIVDLYIHYLRKKLSHYHLDNFIRTVRGVGYMLKGEKLHVQENSDAPGHS
jgi:two-component system, OmpR family, response regulator CiaR